MLHAMCLMVTWFNLDTVMRGADINEARDEGTRSLASDARWSTRQVGDMPMSRTLHFPSKWTIRVDSSA